MKRTAEPEPPKTHEHDWTDSSIGGIEICTGDDCHKLKIRARVAWRGEYGYFSEKVVEVILDGERAW